MRARTLTRKTVVIPGYDCVASPCGRNGCGEPGRTGASHGRCADRWEFTVTDGEVALSVVVISDELRGEYCPELKHYDPARPLVEICNHTSFPRAEHEELVRGGNPGQECEYLDGGRCYAGHYGLGWGRDFFTKHGGLASRINSGPALPEQFEGFWKALEVLHAEEGAKLRADSIAHWHQCPGCQGRGVIEGNR